MTNRRRPSEVSKGRPAHKVLARHPGPVDPCLDAPEPPEGVIAGVVAGVISGVSAASVGWMWPVVNPRWSGTGFASASPWLSALNVLRTCDLRHVNIDVLCVPSGGYSEPRRLRRVLRAAPTGALEGCKMGIVGTGLPGWWGDDRATSSSEPTGTTA